MSTEAIMRLTVEETMELVGYLGGTSEEATQAIEEGKLSVHMSEHDFLTWYINQHGSLTQAINALADTPKLTMLLGSEERAILASTGAIILTSGVVVVPQIRQAEQKELVR